VKLNKKKITTTKNKKKYYNYFIKREIEIIKRVDFKQKLTLNHPSL
jgi:hypothetical protein